MEELKEVKESVSKEPANVNEGQGAMQTFGKRDDISPQCQCSKNTKPLLNASPSYKAAMSFVYAKGKIEPRFPNLSVEKEVAQAAGRLETQGGGTDPQVLQSVLSKPENRYLLRHICWVMSIRGVPTYILVPRDPTDYNLLAESVRPMPSTEDVDVVIGIKGPLAPPEMCNGLTIPMVFLDQIYSFEHSDLIKSIERPNEIAEKDFEAAARATHDLIMQMADNAGATDEHRALNYLVVRYKELYSSTAKAFARNLSLTNIEVLPSRLSGVRKIVDVIITFTDRKTDVIEKYFVRVDVTEEFPFLVTKMSPYYDRS